LGGLYVRRFAARFPDDVAGLVLVDSADEKQLTGIIAPGLQPELYRPGAMSDSELQVFFRDLGQRMLAQRTAPAAGNTNRASDGAAGEIRTAQFYRQIANDRRDFMFSPKPLIVLTATLTAPMPRFSAGQRAQLEEDHRTLQARMRLLSRNSKQILVPNSGHYVHLDRPDIVIAAIREVVTAVRRGGPLDPEGNLERLRL
jgi:pimeloyl-ACP methyl ester carboxylesterase